MNTQPSIRALGLLTLLQTHPHVRTVQDLEVLCSESPQYVSHTLTELVSSGSILVTDDHITVLEEPEELVAANKTLEDRIYTLFSNRKPYTVIAWFLGQLDKSFELDSELRERVTAEYDAATVVQFWSKYHIENAMKRALVDKSIGTVTLEDLRVLLWKRDRGEIVWEK